MPSMRAVALAILSAGSAVVAVSAPAVAAVSVTTCGQNVIGSGYLVASLDCSAYAGDSISLRGRLDLNGFTLTGNPAFGVVDCESGECQVRGPGGITGGHDGVRSDAGAYIIDATIQFNAGDGVHAERTIRLKGAVTIANNGGAGVKTAGPVSVTGGTPTVTYATVSGNGEDGILATGLVSGKNLITNANGDDGIESSAKITLRHSVSQLNGFDGLEAPKISIRDTPVVSNRASPECGVEPCADLAASFVPSVLGVSICESSRNLVTPGNWSVCSLD